MRRPSFNITKDFYKRNLIKIKKELQSYVDGTAEMCGVNSEEHSEALKTQRKIMKGNLKELEVYLLEVFEAVKGQPEIYCPGDKTFIELIQDLNKEELCQSTELKLTELK